MSEATRDRIGSFGGATLEETIIEALDYLDRDRFWSPAAAAAQQSLSADARAERAEREARVIVVPDISGPFNADEYPRRVPFGGSVFAVGFVRGIPAQRLLDRVDQIDATTLNTFRSALRQLTT